MGIVGCPDHIYGRMRAALLEAFIMRQKSKSSESTLRSPSPVSTKPRGASGVRVLEHRFSPFRTPRVIIFLAEIGGTGVPPVVLGVPPETVEQCRLDRIIHPSVAFLD
jgi:hypothetical protein